MVTAGNELDFFATFGGGSDPYNLKRQWRICDRLAPLLELPDDEEFMAALKDRALRFAARSAEPPPLFCC